MSRLMKSTRPTQDTYIQFRFENSLRKYERKPIKKIKPNECLSKRSHPISPIHTLYHPHPTKGKTTQEQQNTIERRSGFEKMSQGHMFSSNKSIKLSKQKVSDQPSELKNNLEMKIYASLINIQKPESKQQSLEEKSELEEDVFLNDFESQEGMEEEKEVERDRHFGSIQINEKSPARKEEEKNAEKYVRVSPNLREKEIPSNYSQNEQNIDDECISLKIQKLRVQEDGYQAHPAQGFIQADIKQHQDQPIILSSSCPVEHQQALVTSIQLQPINICQPQRIQQQNNPYLRQHPQQQQAILSQTHQSILDKCLAFQGGRIYIDSLGQHFHISVRGFNKLIKQYSNPEEVIKALLSQRPYLEGKKEQIQMELQEYLQKHA